MAIKEATKKVELASGREKDVRQQHAEAERWAVVDGQRRAHAAELAIGLQAATKRLQQARDMLDGLQQRQASLVAEMDEIVQQQLDA